MSDAIRREVTVILDAARDMHARDDAQTHQQAVARMLHAVTEITRLRPMPVAAGDFFSAIGEGLANAQEQLDRASREYNRELAQASGHPGVACSFRIPRLSAEMHFELSQVDGNHVGMILHRRQQQQRHDVEHRIRFEVVALPPPADLRIDIARERLSFRFEHDPDTRNELLSALVQREAVETEATRKSKLGSAIAGFAGLRILQQARGHLIMQPMQSPLGQFELRMIYVGRRRRARDVRVSSGREGLTFFLLPFFERLLHAEGRPIEPTPETKDLKAAQKDAARRLARAARRISRERGPVKQSFDALLDAAADLEKLQPEARDSSPIGDFIEGVARSVVHAQRELDARSSSYIARKPLVPASFRIPAAEAELSFAVASTRRRQLNALIYGEQQALHREREQRIKFDVVSAPLPADTGGADPQQEAIEFERIDDPKLRASIRQALLQRSALAQGRRSTRVAGRSMSAEQKAAYLATPERFQHATILGDAGGYTLLLRTKRPRGRFIIDVAYFTEDLEPSQIKLWGALRKAPRSFARFFDPWLAHELEDQHSHEAEQP